MMLRCLESPGHIRGVCNGSGHHLRAMLRWLKGPREYSRGGRRGHQVHQGGTGRLRRPEGVQILQSAQQELRVQGVHGRERGRNRPHPPLNRAANRGACLPAGKSFRSECVASQRPRNERGPPVPFNKLSINTLLGIFLLCLSIIQRTCEK